MIMNEQQVYKKKYFLFYFALITLAFLFTNIQILLSGEKKLEIYNFHNSDRYYPYLHKQYYYPKFIWDEFYEINNETWGDNTNGNIKLIPETNPATNHVTGEKIKNNNVFLLPNQMIWSLQRHNYGQVEFRGIEFDRTFNDKFIEGKFFGFGDPSEGYAAGFNITQFNNSNVVELLVVNHNVRRGKYIKWDPKYNGARFIVNWTKNEISFIIILSDATESLLVGHFKNTDNKKEVESKIPNINDKEFTIPNIGMEISIQNYLGSNIILKHVKYDAINF